MKKLIWISLATFVTILFTDFIIHGVILKQTYMDTASLWRPQADQASFLKWMFIGQFIMSMFFAVIFTHGYKGKGWTEGVRFGLLMGAVNMGQQLIMYSVRPIPMSLTMAWIFWAFVQLALTGVVTSWVFQKVNQSSNA